MIRPSRKSLSILSACIWTHRTKHSFYRWMRRARSRRPTAPSQGCRGVVFKSVTDLEIAIHRYLAKHNDHPKPFVWNAKAADILAKVRRGKQALESEH